MCVHMCVSIYMYMKGVGRVVEGDHILSVLERMALLREKMEMCKAKQRPEGDPRSLERGGGGASRGLLALLLQAKPFLRHNCTFSFGACESPLLGHILSFCLS